MPSTMNEGYAGCTGQSKPRSRTAELQVSATKDKKPSLFVEETGSPNPTILAVGVLFALVAAALVAALFIPKYSGQEESGEKAFQADPSKQKGATPLPAGPAPKGYDYKQTPPAGMQMSTFSCTGSKYLM